MATDMRSDRLTFPDLGLEKNSHLTVPDVALLDYRRRSRLLTPFGWFSALALIAVVLGAALAFAI